jgi:hypothetical protein
MLQEAEPLRRATRKGGARQPALQLALPFDAAEDDRTPELVRAAPAPDFASLPAAEQAQRLAWELHILGLPVSALAHPLAAARDPVPEHLPLRRLGETPGRPVIVTGARLPGWTGGPGFFLTDGDTFVIAKGEKSLRAPAAWRPLVVRGRWLSDSWGNAWLQADQVTELREHIADTPT